MLVYSQDTKSHFKRDPFCFREHTIEIIRIKCNYAQICMVMEFKYYIKKYNYQGC